MKARGCLASVPVAASFLLCDCASNASVETTMTAGEIEEGGLFRTYWDSRGFLDPFEDFLYEHADRLDLWLGLESPGDGQNELGSCRQ